MTKKPIVILSLVAVTVAAVAFLAFLLIPQKTAITVSYTNPAYSRMDVTLRLQPSEEIGGFDCSLFYNLDKWELDETSVQYDGDIMEVRAERGEIRLICENSTGEAVPEVLLTLSFEMIGKVEDPLGLRLDVHEMYSANSFADLAYQVNYTEEKQK